MRPEILEDLKENDYYLIIRDLVSGCQHHFERYPHVQYPELAFMFYIYGQANKSYVNAKRYQYDDETGQYDDSIREKWMQVWESAPHLLGLALKEEKSSQTFADFWEKGELAYKQLFNRLQLVLSKVDILEEIIQVTPQLKRVEQQKPEDDKEANKIYWILDGVESQTKRIRMDIDGHRWRDPDTILHTFNAVGDIINQLEEIKVDVTDHKLLQYEWFFRTLYDVLELELFIRIIITAAEYGYEKETTKYAAPDGTPSVLYSMYIALQKTRAES